MNKKTKKLQETAFRFKSKAEKNALEWTHPNKLLAGGVGLLAVGFGLKNLFSLFSKSHAVIPSKNLDSAIHQEKQNGSYPSYPNAQYDIFADNIEEATNTSGTDEEAIYNVMRALQNNADLLKLQKAYGQRINWWFGIPTGKYSLSQVLDSELDDSEKETLRKIIEAKGITIKII